MTCIDTATAWEARAKLASYADLHSTAEEWYAQHFTCPYCNGDALHHLKQLDAQRTELPATPAHP